MVRAVDKADANADAFQRSIISGAIYHFLMQTHIALLICSLAGVLFMLAAV